MSHVKSMLFALAGKNTAQKNAFIERPWNLITFFFYKVSIITRSSRCHKKSMDCTLGQRVLMSFTRIRFSVSNEERKQNNKQTIKWITKIARKRSELKPTKTDSSFTFFFPILISYNVQRTGYIHWHLLLIHKADIIALHYI